MERTWEHLSRVHCSHVACARSSSLAWRGSSPSPRVAGSLSEEPESQSGRSKPQFVCGFERSRPGPLCSGCPTALQYFERTYVLRPPGLINGGNPHTGARATRLRVRRLVCSSQCPAPTVRPRKTGLHAPPRSLWFAREHKRQLRRGRAMLSESYPQLAASEPWHDHARSMHPRIRWRLSASLSSAAHGLGSILDLRKGRPRACPSVADAI